MAEITASTKKVQEPTTDEMFMIARGERPEWMDYDVFRSYRKTSQKFIRQHLKGKYVKKTENT